MDVNQSANQKEKDTFLCIIIPGLFGITSSFSMEYVFDARVLLFRVPIIRDEGSETNFSSFFIIIYIT
jgi:hypothetical protein